jgi:hypothetical protein
LEERGIGSVEECEEIVENLELKLGVRQKPVKTDKEKYDLVDISDSDLNED